MAGRTHDALLRRPAAELDAIAREIADIIAHRIGHAGDALQVYADLTDARAVALRAAAILLDEGSDALLTLAGREPSAAVTAALVSAEVGTIAERTVHARWASARRMRADAQELLDAEEVAWRAERAARTAAAVRVRATAAVPAGAATMRDVVKDAAAVLRLTTDAASVQLAHDELARDGAPERIDA